MTATTSYLLETKEIDRLSSIDIREIAIQEGGYEGYRVIPIKADGYQDSAHGEMVWHAEAGRAGIAFGADGAWTDADSPEDAVERFFGINDKEMAN